MNSIFNLSKVGFADVAVHGNNAWVCNIFFSSLFHVDLKTLSLDLVAILPAEEASGTRQYAPIEYYNENLIIAPQNADKILIYGLHDGEINEIFVGDYVGTYFNQLFWGISIFNNCAYFFPGRSRVIIKLDLLTYKIECIDGWYREIERDITDKNRIIFFDKLDLDNGIVLLPCWQSGKILQFDMKTDKYTLISFSNLDALSGCGYWDGKWLLLERDFNSLTFYGHSDMEKLQVSLPGFETYRGFRQIYIYRDQAFLFPLYGNMIIKYNLRDKKMECVKNLPMEYSSAWEIPDMGMNNMLGCRMVNGYEVLYYSVLDGKIVKLNLDSCEFKEKSADLKESDRVILKKQLFHKCFGHAVFETVFTGLVDSMDFLEQDTGNYARETTEGNIGKMIYIALRDTKQEGI